MNDEGYSTPSAGATSSWQNAPLSFTVAPSQLRLLALRRWACPQHGLFSSWSPTIFSRNCRASKVERGWLGSCRWVAI